jgi:hypothetical protein
MVDGHFNGVLDRRQVFLLAASIAAGPTIDEITVFHGLFSLLDCELAHIGEPLHRHKAAIDSRLALVDASPNQAPRPHGRDRAA